MKSKKFSKLKVKNLQKEELHRLRGGAPTCGDCVDLGCPNRWLCQSCIECHL